MQTCNYMDNIRIVLVQTFHPGNIGSAARAMKNMGLNNLYLVSPEQLPHPEANKMAAGATDVLDNCKQVVNLDEAIYDCSLVIGTSSRHRSEVSNRPLLDTKEVANKIAFEATKTQVALVFGPETSGLANHDLEKCHFHAYINSCPVYPVLNLAAAVQIFCYEIYQQLTQNNCNDKSGTYPKSGYPSATKLKLLYEHIEKWLHEINFIVKRHPGNIMQHLKKILIRARLDNKDVNILRGIITRMQQLNLKKISKDTTLN